MDERVSNGAQFLIARAGEFKKVTAFPEFPIELQTLTAVDLSEDEFLNAGRVGFILTNVGENDATIKFLNNENKELLIPFSKRINFTVNDDKYEIELWAIRYNSSKWDQWKISFS